MHTSITTTPARGGYRATCACGWQSLAYAVEVTATKQGIAHVRKAMQDTRKVNGLAAGGGRQ